MYGLSFVVTMVFEFINLFIDPLEQDIIIFINYIISNLSTYL
jgi:hypothetical protein